MTKQEAIHLVEQHLAAHQPADYRLKVLADATRRDDDWWYVAVQADREGVRNYAYYDVLAQVEREIEDEHEDVNIVLVPVAAEAA